MAKMVGIVCGQYAKAWTEFFKYTDFTGNGHGSRFEVTGEVDVTLTPEEIKRQNATDEPRQKLQFVAVSVYVGNLIKSMDNSKKIISHEKKLPLQY